MDDLFAPIRPKAGLEERVIRGLRSAPPQKTRSLASRVILAAAAVVLMGVLGFVIIQVDQGGLNSTEQVVIAGHTGAVRRAIDLAKAAGARRAVQLPVSAPFHCALMKPAQERLKPDLDAAWEQLCLAWYELKLATEKNGNSKH